MLVLVVRRQKANRNITKKNRVALRKNQ